MYIQIEIVLTEIQLYRGGHRKTNAEKRGANVSVKGQPASACEEPEGADPCSPAQRGTGALSRLCRSDAQQMHRKVAPRTHRAARRARGRHQSGVEEGLVMRRKG